MERCIYDRGGVERGQRNKLGRIEEEANQLYRRPQMTGQARDEEDEKEILITSCCIISPNHVVV